VKIWMKLLLLCLSPTRERYAPAKIHRAHCTSHRSSALHNTTLRRSTAHPCVAWVRPQPNMSKWVRMSVHASSRQDVFFCFCFLGMIDSFWPAQAFPHLGFVFVALHLFSIFWCLLHSLVFMAHIEMNLSNVHALLILFTASSRSGMK